ncbi:MAG: glycosyltransferase family 4 protein [Bacteroidales bacterium]|nr:glycosyltransferase family 4 protein [Bacteroidales bacterium]MBD5301511.1 glycosyltransferase family 4 protein [Bacteroides sp.]
MTKNYNTKNSDGLYGIFNDSFPPILDGVTLTVENYVYWLMKKGLKPCVVTPWNPVSTPVDCEIMKFFSLPIQSRKPYRYGYPKLDPFIWKKLRNTNFRLVHAHCPFSTGRLGVYVKKKNGVPLIGTFHSKYRDDLKHSFKSAPWMVNIIMKRILNFFNACDEVWIPQAQVEETVREYGYKGPLTVVENGNDFASLAGSDINSYKSAAKKEFGIADDELSLLFVGQHIFEKGIDIVVDTLKLLDGKIKFKMNFIGTGYAFDDIKKSINQAGLDDRVKLNGVISERDKLSRYYAASDLFLFPSFYDNAPLVIREAAAMGTPSILLKGSTASEVITDGVNGFLTEKDPHKFAELVTELSRDKSKLIQAARGARSSLVRSWEDVVGEVVDRYESLVKRHNK